MARLHIHMTLTVPTELQPRRSLAAILVELDMIRGVYRFRNHRQCVHERSRPLESLDEFVGEALRDVSERLYVFLRLLQTAAVFLVVLDDGRVAENVVEHDGKQLGEEGLDRVLERHVLSPRVLFHVQEEVTDDAVVLPHGDAVHLAQANRGPILGFF